MLAYLRKHARHATGLSFRHKICCNTLVLQTCRETNMASVRLDPEIEEKLAQICLRRGLTKSDCVRLAIDRFVAAEAQRDPYEMLTELRDRYGVKGGELSDGARRHSELVKARIRAKHRR
jgi:predicted DNA-binding protein